MSSLDGTVCFPLSFLQTVIKSMGWNLVGPVVRCLLRGREEDKREECFLIFDLLVKVSGGKFVLLLHTQQLHNSLPQLIPVL